jgi:aminopeptidase-like protein
MNNNRDKSVEAVTPSGGATIGQKMHDLITELYPICRSITGDGVRKTLAILRRYIPLEIHEVPSDTAVFDWTVPKEWNIRDAYVKNSKGERIIDFMKSNLHVVSYSRPIREKMRLAELRKHLFSLPDHPEWIPYRTSYYQENWGFCVSHRQLQDLKDEEYEVCIDSSLTDGNLTYGEFFIRGASADEVLISCHVCHPSLCNDNLSGVALVTHLASHIAHISPRYSYRFLLIPGTIGSITWLARNDRQISRIRHGLVVTCVGDGGKFTYKKSRQGNAEIDRAVMHVLKHSGSEWIAQEFFPYGYDERQYCSPGFDLPVGCLMRSPHGTFPEYHTSADNLDFVRPEYLEKSLAMYRDVIDVLEHNVTYRNLNPKCEPQLGRRGLYQAIGGDSESARKQLAMLWVLNLSDGRHSLLDIAERAGYDFGAIKAIANTLLAHDLLEPISKPPLPGGERESLR